MYKEPEAMREIHKIQEKIHEETKHMTPKEYIKYIHRAAERTKKKYGLRFRKPKKAHH
jgi:predicted neutral ceramidase superfamily lipid hydrolase